MVEVALTVGIVAIVVVILSWVTAAMSRPDPIEAMIGTSSMTYSVSAVLFTLGIVVAPVAFAVAAIGSVWK